jgi:tRNA dimethylallyltransferase
MNEGPVLVTVVGPTGAGKTDFAIELALAIDGEIVSADSRQVYMDMEIGTAKASPAQRALVPHYLLDVVKPSEVLTLADYQSMAYREIDRISGRGKVPLLVGGTGQYVRAILEGWSIPQVAPQPDLRARLEAQAERHGTASLHAQLKELDPVAAARIDPRNVRRVIRALEVTLTAGVPISELQGKRTPAYRVVQLGITRPRDVLHRRIDGRVDRMFGDGLVGEVQALVARGFGWELPAMSGLGYRQVGAHLRGEITLPEAVERVKHDTHRFVRQQYNWFRLDDPEIVWLDPDGESLGRAIARVSSGIAL